MTDAERASATVEELNKTTELFYHVPQKHGNDDEAQWPPAVRADLPLRNDKGGIVADWSEQDESLAQNQVSVWSRSIGDMASGKVPSYRLGISQADLEQAAPPEEFVRQMCHDARELVIGCAIHVCSPSCWKYHSKGSAHICRHHFYHVVTFLDEDYWEVKRRRSGQAAP